MSAPPRRFLHGFVETLLTRGTIVILSLGTTIAATRVLGPQGRGDYAVATVIAGLGVQLANMGLPSANTFHLGRSAGKLGVLLGNSLAAVLAIGLASAVGIAAYAALRPGPVPGGRLLLAAALVWIPLGLVLLIVQSLLMAAQAVRAFNIVDLVPKLCAAVVLAAVILTHTASTAAVFASGLLGVLVGTALSWGFLRPLVTDPIRFDKGLLWSQLRYGFRAYLVTLLPFVMIRSGVIIVRRAQGQSATGIYSVALAMIDIVGMAASVAGMLVFPRLMAMPDDEARWRFTGRVVGAMALLMTVGVASAFLLAQPATHLLFGSRFDSATACFRVMLPGAWLIALETVAVQYLNAKGLPNAVVFVWVAGTFVTIATTIALVRPYGIIGAGIAQSIGAGVVSIGVAILLTLNRPLKGERGRA